MAAICSLPDPKTCPISGTPCPGECLFADVLSSENQGVIVFDLRHEEFAFVNRPAREILERAGMRCCEYREIAALFLPPPDELAKMPSSTTGRPIQIGTRLIGHTLYQAPPFAWVFARDITDKARMESIASAVEQMSHIEYIFSGVRHELGNPVNSVKAALSVLHENIDRFPRATIVEYLERMTEQMGRLENLLRSLRSFSLFEDLQLEPLDASAFVHSFAALVEADAMREGVSVRVEAEPGLWVRADRRALHQVLLNLYSNAVEALKSHSQPAVVLEVKDGDGLVHLGVTDNGPGLAAADRAQLFRPFFTTKREGTGLGLVLSRKMVARMGGTIEIESTPYRGTTARLTLPPTEARAAAGP